MGQDTARIGGPASGTSMTTDHVEEEMLIAGISIDGMCGVY